MKTIFMPKGVCSSQIEVTLEGDIVSDVKFMNGCNGNLSGISSLVKGMKTNEAVKRLKGIPCGSKPTSCPDQLAQAIEQAVQKRG